MFSQNNVLVLAITVCIFTLTEQKVSLQFSCKIKKLFPRDAISISSAYERGISSRFSDFKILFDKFDFKRTLDDSIFI